MVLGVIFKIEAILDPPLKLNKQEITSTSLAVKDMLLIIFNWLK